jgi:DNA-binding NarL/FixJ family response regulator
MLVADDHEIIPKGVLTILAAHFDLEAFIEASTGQEAIEKAVSEVPDIINFRHKYACSRRLRCRNRDSTPPPSNSHTFSYDAYRGTVRLGSAQRRCTEILG